MFDSLPPELQNIISFNHIYLSNILFLLIVFSLSGFYIFYYKNKFEKSTTSMAVGVFRITFSVFSYLTMFLTPFFLYLLNPTTVQNNSFVTFYTVYYFTFLGLMSVLFLLDVLRYLPFVMMKFAGFDFGDQESKRVYKNIKDEMEKLPFIKNGR